MKQIILSAVMLLAVFSESRAFGQCRGTPVAPNLIAQYNSSHAALDSIIASYKNAFLQCPGTVRLLTESETNPMGFNSPLMLSASADLLSCLQPYQMVLHNGIANVSAWYGALCGLDGGAPSNLANLVPFTTSNAVDSGTKIIGDRGSAICGGSTPVAPQFQTQALASNQALTQITQTYIGAYSNCASAHGQPVISLRTANVADASPLSISTTAGFRSCLAPFQAVLQNGITNKAAWYGAYCGLNGSAFTALVPLRY